MRYLLLDLIRSIAIILVLAAHIGQAVESPLGMFFGIPNFYYVSLGGIAVTIFLLLSGLTLELSYGSRNITFSRFMAKRILRIQPVYYLSLIVGIIVYLGKHIYYTEDFSAIVSVLNPFDLLCTITGFYAFTGHWGGPFLATSWFIGLIFAIYVAYPTISRSMKKHPHITILVLFIVSSLSRLILGQYDLLPKRPLDWFPFCRIFEFGLGVYAAHVLKTDIWGALNKYKKITQVLLPISNISFPLFLVHYPLLHIMTYFIQIGSSRTLCVFLFVITSVLISWTILNIDNRVPRQLIFNKLFDAKINQQIKNEVVWPYGQAKSENLVFRNKEPYYSAEGDGDVTPNIG